MYLQTRNNFSPSLSAGQLAGVNMLCKITSANSLRTEHGKIGADSLHVIERCYSQQGRFSLILAEGNHGFVYVF